MFLLSADVGSKAISAVATVAIARYLGQEQYGVLSAGIAFVGLAAIFGDFGVNQVVVRQRARRPADSSILQANGLFLVGFQCLLTYLLIVVASQATIDSEAERKLVAILAVAAVIGGWGGQSLYMGLTGVGAAILQGQQRMGMVALLQAANRLGFLGAIVLTIVLDMGLFGVAVTYVTVAVLTFALSLSLTTAESSEWGLKWATIRYLRREAWAFGLSALFVAIYGKADTLILSFLRTHAEVGAYNAAYTLVGMLFFLPSTLARSILPHMYQLHKTNQERLQTVAEDFLRWMVGLVMPVSVGMSILSREINDLVYGPKYDAAVPLSILAWFLVFRFSAAAPGYLLTATDNQGKLLWVHGAGAVTNVVTNLILIPRYGTIGAAISMIISEAVLLGGSYLLAWACFSRLRIERFVVVPTLASAVMGVVLVFLRGKIPSLVLVPVAGGIYVALLLLLRFITLREIVEALSFGERAG